MKPATGLSLAHRPAADEPHVLLGLGLFQWPEQSSSLGARPSSDHGDADVVARPF
jgi:hypothetical protein